MVSKVSRIDIIGQNGNDGEHYSGVSIELETFYPQDLPDNGTAVLLDGWRQVHHKQVDAVHDKIKEKMLGSNTDT
tara:strand:- start:23085 stop:23309 length:225 start_codon:yes stop_codon:yes gene_type:complete